MLFVGDECYLICRLSRFDSCCKPLGPPTDRCRSPSLLSSQRLFHRSRAIERCVAGKVCRRIWKLRKRRLDVIGLRGWNCCLCNNHSRFGNDLRGLCRGRDPSRRNHSLDRTRSMTETPPEMKLGNCPAMCPHPLQLYHCSAVAALPPLGAPLPRTLKDLEPRHPGKAPAKLPRGLRLVVVAKKH